jgi:hypothetical protein
MKQKNYIYIVNAYRFFSRENHSYTVGVFQKKSLAIDCADKERNDRGGKYACQVERFELNHHDIEYSMKVIYVSLGYNPNKIKGNI